MIVRHLPVRAGRNSSFAGLVKYITSGQGKQERVGEIHITNCLSHDVVWATHEVLATQAQNQRTQCDKTYHLLISFPPGETPSSEVLKDIEDRVCASIGYGEHQRISAIHYDTDHLHIHIGINKIHPTRFTAHLPYYDYKAFGDIAAKLEIEHGLQQVNHKARKTASENRADDMEHHAAEESLLNWIKRDCIIQFQNAKNWSELHAVMRENGLELCERGSGLIIIDRAGMAVKASSVSRDFSKNKLEKRYGEFERNSYSQSSKKQPLTKRQGVAKPGHKPPPFRQNRLQSLGRLQTLKIDNGVHYNQRPIHMSFNTVELYARYKNEQQQALAFRSKDLGRSRARKDRLIKQAMRSSRLKRTAIKLLKDAGVNKKLLYALVSKALKTDIENARQQHLQERQAIVIKYQRRTWADWLKQRATEGDHEALVALRSREARQKLTGNTITGKVVHDAGASPGISPDNITKTGTVIYRVGTCAIRDDGELLKISRGSSEEGLIAVLTMAMQRYGERISVNGSSQFKERIAEVAAGLKLNIIFEDVALEKRRNDLIQINRMKEINHEHSRQSNLKPRGTNRGGNESIAANRTRGIQQRDGKSNVGITNKPNLRRIGQQPPPESKNRLRDLSQLGVVQLAGRSEVLLPGDVSRNLEHQGTQSDNRLRRNVSGAGAVNKGEEAAEKYITERNLTREKVVAIPKHRRYHSGDEGSVQFAGIRQIDDESLVLLKCNEEVIVMPIDAPMERRMKKLSLGAAVTLTSKGVIIIRGRRR